MARGNRNSKRVARLSLFFDAISENTKSKRLSCGCGFLFRFSVGENAGQLDDLRYPPAIFFPLSFDGVLCLWHARDISLPRGNTQVATVSL